MDAWKTGPAASAALGLAIRDIIHKPLNWDRYRDLESELNQETLVEFVQNFAEKYK
jgi:hypothetical protein